MLLTIRPFVPYLPSLTSISPLLLFIPSIYFILLHNSYGRQRVSKNIVVIARKPHVFNRDELVILIVPDSLPHILIFSIRHPTVILLYCVVDIF